MFCLGTPKFIVCFCQYKRAVGLICFSIFTHLLYFTIDRGDQNTSFEEFKSLKIDN